MPSSLVLFVSGLALITYLSRKVINAYVAIKVCLPEVMKRHRHTKQFMFRHSKEFQNISWLLIPCLPLEIFCLIRV